MQSREQCEKCDVVSTVRSRWTIRERGRLWWTCPSCEHKQILEAFGRVVSDDVKRLIQMQFDRARL